MRVSRAQAEKNREKVITEASRLFRKHGFDGIGLKDLMKGAGLTQGAFYKQFASKEDLTAQSSQRAFERAGCRWSAAIEANPDDPLGAVLDFYLSMDHRENSMDGCPIVALAADAARQSSGVKEPFETGIRAHLEILTRLLGEDEGAECSARSMAIFSTMIGAVTLSRAVNDNRLSKQILQAAADQIRAAIAPKQRRSRRMKTQKVRP